MEAAGGPAAGEPGGGAGAGGGAGGGGGAGAAGVPSAAAAVSPLAGLLAGAAVEEALVKSLSRLYHTGPAKPSSALECVHARAPHPSPARPQLPAPAPASAHPVPHSSLLLLPCARETGERGAFPLGRKASRRN